MLLGFSRENFMFTLINCENPLCVSFYLFILLRRTFMVYIFRWNVCIVRYQTYTLKVSDATVTLCAALRRSHCRGCMLASVTISFSAVDFSANNAIPCMYAMRDARQPPRQVILLYHLVFGQWRGVCARALVYLR